MYERIEYEVLEMPSCISFPVREKEREAAEELAAKSELLLAEEAGLLEGDDVHEFTGQIKQTEIRACVDKETAAKGFELNLREFGPYK